MDQGLTDQEIVEWTSHRLKRRGLNPHNWQLIRVLLNREVYLFRNAHRREQITVYQRPNGELFMGNLWGE
ncbi:hypothetical protein [Levilactobacillus spicheri]|jgi:hypothetical protein|uniref:Uncharacterized protein n=2 Tax=Levilactobacillus spicheri TaxID=216463 RepID=A0A0F3RS70_9LACO|nr:hypothetical protein [Levilactobacillus spicheri]KJW12826.1 hypothetical protein VC81_06100 [Levilactobacillus spicheri]KRL46475.1 hypothetical protein FD37_GL000702 [Levilactobacillus spicheri DSM 15429]GEO67965.1 hypothetical protein LSP04_23840 [Levilactobacillus spicheri]